MNVGTQKTILSKGDGQFELKTRIKYNNCAHVYLTW